MVNVTGSEETDLKRRDFLTHVGTLGAVLAGASASGCAFAREAIFSNAGDCSFSLLPDDFIYLNTGTEGSMPNCVLKTLQDKQHQWASDPTTSYETDEDLNKYQHANRTRVAEFLGVEKNNICLTDNTTMGTNMVINGLSFQAGDRVIITNHEHNAINSPTALQQAKAGIKVLVRELPSASKLRKMGSRELLDTLLPNTAELRGAKALCVSHVYPTTGLRLPLNLLRQKADELGIEYLIVDGAQAFGKVDVTQGSDKITYTDFYACPGHKWLNGPPSTGILFIKDADIRPPELYPVMSQRMTNLISGSNPTYPMAEALQVRGCSNTPGFSAMITALDLVTKLGGPAVIENMIMKRSKMVKDFIMANAPGALVSPYEAEGLYSGLTVFFPFRWGAPDNQFSDKETNIRVVNALLQRNIQIRTISFHDPSNRERKVNALRVSTALFNSDEQINHFFDALQHVLSSPDVIKQ